MRPPPPPREALTFAAIAFEAGRVAPAIDLRLRSGDEGRQAIDAAIIRNRGLLRRLVARFAVFTRLLLSRLIRLLMVALTGWGQEEDRHRSKEAGFDAHMVKPVDHDALLRLLASLPGVDRASSLQA